jgi:error-prone DNA polymerase
MNIPRKYTPTGRRRSSISPAKLGKGPPGAIPAACRRLCAKRSNASWALIGKLDLARYFLTIKDIVDYARGVDPPILCQGRGSAANSAVCYCLGITSVDPARSQPLFERFISEARASRPTSMLISSMSAARR